MRAQSAQRAMLEELYATYNRRQFVHPDPLEFLYEYDNVREREIVALVASSLAYGRVGQILRSVRDVLDRIGAPAAFVRERSAAEIRQALQGFRHRWTTDEDAAALLVAVKGVLEAYGSLEACFGSRLNDKDETVMAALGASVRTLTSASGTGQLRLLADPARGSACKRLHLFLRWMVRRDEVDPGGWESVARSKLVVPLDAHMYALARRLGLTGRGQADGRTALEVTAAFRAINAADPVKYDFALTRVGIRTEMDAAGFSGRSAA